MPVLVDGDEVVPDSYEILEWLERRFPEPALYPRDAARRAEVRIFADWFNELWKRPPNLILLELEKPDPDAARIAELGARMRGSLAVFEELLERRDYLFGDFGAADCLAFPFLKYAVFGAPPDDDELFHRILVERQPLDGGYPRLRAWAERVDVHPRS